MLEEVVKTVTMAMMRAKRAITVDMANRNFRWIDMFSSHCLQQAVLLDVTPVVGWSLNLNLGKKKISANFNSTI